MPKPSNLGFKCHLSLSFWWAVSQNSAMYYCELQGFPIKFLVTHTLKFPQKRFSFVSTKNPKVIIASLEPTFTLNFLAWDFLDLITSLNIRWTIKARSQVTNSWKKTQGPGLLSPMLIQRFFPSSFFHWRYSILNIQVLCKSQFPLQGSKGLNISSPVLSYLSNKLQLSEYCDLHPPLPGTAS